MCTLRWNEGMLFMQDFIMGEMTTGAEMSIEDI